MININKNNLKSLQSSILSAHVDIKDRQKIIKNTLEDVGNNITLFIQKLISTQNNIKQVTEDLIQVTDDLIDITGADDDFKGLIEIKEELEENTNFGDDFISSCKILYNPNNVCVSDYSSSKDTDIFIDNGDKFKCTFDFTFGDFNCLEDYNGEDLNNYSGDKLDCVRLFSDGKDTTCGIGYIIKEGEVTCSGDYDGKDTSCSSYFFAIENGAACGEGYHSPGGITCENTYLLNMGGETVLCTSGFSQANGGTCGTNFSIDISSEGISQSCESNFSGAKVDCPNGYYVSSNTGTTCSSMYTNSSGVECQGSYMNTPSGSGTCEGGYSHDDIICPVSYSTNCSNNDGSNTCSSCDSSCYSGNTETCSECVSSCNSENTVCPKCHEGGWTAPCYQVCTPTNNSCAVTYANACAASYIAQCTVCVGGCHSGCNQGFSTSGCSSSNDMSGE